MDRYTELNRQRPAAGLGDRRGAAMATALFAIAVVAVLAAGVHWMTRADIRTTANRESAVRAMAIAEAGLAHAMMLVKDTLGDTTMTRLLRGFDGTKNTADDGYLINYPLLSTAAQIPSTGRTVDGGTYFVRLTDDPAEKDGDPLTDRNTRVLATCRGVAADGSSATINAIIGNMSVPGIAVEGDVTVGGNVTVRGRCGSVHSNEDMVVTGSVIVEGNVSAVATATLSGGAATNTYGEPLTVQGSSEKIELPTLTAAAYCGRADYEILSNNTVRINATGGTTTPLLLGWLGAYPLFEAAATVTEGTYCVNGNVRLAGPIGTELARKRISLIVKGATEIAGNPWLEPEDADGIMVITDGDLKLTGNASIGGTTDNFQGFIYAGGHCYVAGRVRLTGQIICKNNPDPPPPTIDHQDVTTIAGTVNINYPCRGFLSQLWRVVAWYPSPGA